MLLYIYQRSWLLPLPVKGQPSFDKQYVRDWLKANPDNDFLLPEEVVTKTVDKYKEAFALLTGKEFK